MHTRNYSSLPSELTPFEALQLLKEGNFRFINNLSRNRDLLELVNKTKDGQWPFAAILSCMDSRTSAELVFDQGLGDIFSVRIAGNVVMEEVLGSLEYATAVAGSKLIVVLGHSNCGAIKGACDHVELGNLTTLLDRIQPAVERETTVKTGRNSHNPEFVEAVAHLNVAYSVEEILRQSKVIRELVEDGRVGIIPAMYDVATGKVKFIEEIDVPAKTYEETQEVM
ncbi:carbonic anhydrase family protein [Chitinophagaceae bacterium MMS25-I14]